ncbi:hemerythrin [Thermus scotoductus]|uniref:Hemerythrin n=1 Tax=Thermus scotoductus TaxID=37636 RepID=A0A430RM50_THESC|nr:hemerythrin domain-containing protein [Thermus scotoductus]RTH18901.1 hemerythrin [Thermus scotoductus]
MVEPFEGKALVRPGGRVEPLDLAPGERRTLAVERSEDALLVGLQGTLVLRFRGRSLRLGPGKTARLRPGRLDLEAPEGGRALWVVLGLAQSRLAQDHEALLALLKALPSPEAAFALSRKLRDHIALEEALYYPTLSPGRRRERLLEHRILLELLEELGTALREGRTVQGVVERLKTAFLAHSEAELEA